MSNTNSSNPTPSVGGHTQSGSKIEFTRDCTSGTNGKTIWRFEVNGIDCAAQMVGAHGAKAWKLDNPARMVYVSHGTVTDAALRLQDSITSLDQPTQLTIYRQPPTAMVVWEPVKEWRISQKAIDALWKQATVDKVAMKVHQQGHATRKDVETLKRLRGKVPAASPIDVQSEARKVVGALIDTHTKYAGDWQQAPGYFAALTKGVYSLKEISEGRITLVNGAKGPETVVYRKSQQGGIVLCDVGLRQQVARFVRAVHPGLVERVEPVVKEEVPF